MLLQLLPRQVDVFLARQAVECVRLDRVNDTLRFTCRGNEVEPSAGGE